MDTRVFSLARRDGVTLFKMNVFAFITIFTTEFVLILVMLLIYKLQIENTLVLILAVISIVFPVITIRIYKKITKYQKIVRLKDLIYYFKPKVTRINNYYLNNNICVRSLNIKRKEYVNF